MRQVIVLESRGLRGGAFESTSLLIKNMGHKVDLVIPKCGADYISKRVLKGAYGDNVHRIYEFYLPHSLQNISGFEAYDSLYDMKRKYRLFQIYKKEFYNFLDKQKYDNIHLNGMGLYPVLNKKYPMTLHMRQVFYGGNLEKLKMMFYLKQSKGIVYIDEATHRPFQKMSVPYVVLANPVDQTGVNMISEESVLKKYQIDGRNIIFTIAGTISEGKGVSFVIDAFQEFSKLSNHPCELLIVGDGNLEYKKICHEKAGNNPNIQFLGQLSQADMQKIYKISDYIVRGEDIEAIGRTVWEALYSGDGVILAGNRNMLQEISRVIGHCENTFVYEAGNKESLVKIFLQIQNKKTNCTGRTNAGQYEKEFSQFLDNVLVSEKKRENCR